MLMSLEVETKFLIPSVSMKVLLKLKKEKKEKKLKFRRKVINSSINVLPTLKS
jgi:hypothetical protein